MCNQTHSCKQSRVITTTSEWSQRWDQDRGPRSKSLYSQVCHKHQGKTLRASGNTVLQQQAHADISLQKSPACSQCLTPQPGAPTLSLSPCHVPQQGHVQLLWSTTFPPASSSHWACSTRDKSIPLLPDVIYHKSLIWCCICMCYLKWGFWWITTDRKCFLPYIYIYIYI